MNPRLDPQNSLCCLIAQLNHSVAQEITASLAGVNLTALQLQALAELAKAPGLSTADLARLTFVTPQNMSLAVSNLADRGFVVRSPHPTTTRIHQLALTTRGNRILSRGIARAQQVEKRTFAGLLPSERRKLLDVLRRSLVQFKRAVAAGKGISGGAHAGKPAARRLPKR